MLVFVVRGVGEMVSWRAGLVVFFVVVIISVILLFVMDYYHEEVHKEIMQQDGCNDARVHIGLGSSYTYCLDESYSESKEAMSAHWQNEIRGYNDNYWLLVFVIIMTLLMLQVVKE